MLHPGTSRNAFDCYAKAVATMRGVRVVCGLLTRLNHFFVTAEYLVDYSLCINLLFLSVLLNKVRYVIIQIDGKIESNIRTIEFAAYPFRKIVFLFHVPKYTIIWYEWQRACVARCGLRGSRRTLKRPATADESNVSSNCKPPRRCRGAYVLRCAPILSWSHCKDDIRR